MYYIPSLNFVFLHAMNTTAVENLLVTTLVLHVNLFKIDTHSTQILPRYLSCRQWSHRVHVCSV